MLFFLVVLFIVSRTGFAPNAYGDQAQGGVMSSRPLAFPDERPSNTTYDATNFSSSSSASVVMPFDVDVTRGCYSMGNKILRHARCYMLNFIYFLITVCKLSPDHGLVRIRLYLYERHEVTECKGPRFWSFMSLLNDKVGTVKL